MVEQNYGPHFSLRHGVKNIADTLNPNFDSVFGDKTRMIRHCDWITIGADYRPSHSIAIPAVQ
jgi:hypothetical protein